MPHLDWFRSNGTLLQNSTKHKVAEWPDGRGQLTITQCASSDADTYSCVALNAGGAVQSRCSLNVLGKARGVTTRIPGAFD